MQSARILSKGLKEAKATDIKKVSPNYHITTILYQIDICWGIIDLSYKYIYKDYKPVS